MNLLDKPYFAKRVRAVHDTEVRKYICSAPFDEWYSSNKVFEDTGKYKSVYTNWLLGSRYSNIIGLDKFEEVDFTFGITQSLDDLLFKHKNDRLRIFKYEYHYTNKIHGNYKHIEEGAIQSGEWVLISLPFCFDGKTPSGLKEVLDSAYEVGVPVYIDAAFYALSFDFTLDLSHPAIAEVYFSLSKNLGMGFLRTGIRFSNNPIYGPVSMQNEYNYSNLASVQLGAYVISKFDINHTLDKYKCAYKLLCLENGLSEGNCIHIALGPEEIQGDFLRMNNTTKIGIWWDDEML